MDGYPGVLLGQELLLGCVGPPVACGAQGGYIERLRTRATGNKKDQDKNINVATQSKLMRSCTVILAFLVSLCCVIQ